MCERCSLLALRAAVLGATGSLSLRPQPSERAPTVQSPITANGQRLESSQAGGSVSTSGTSDWPGSVLHGHKLTIYQACLRATLSSHGQPRLPVLMPSCSSLSSGSEPGHTAGFGQRNICKCEASRACKSPCALGLPSWCPATRTQAGLLEWLHGG